MRWKLSAFLTNCTICVLAQAPPITLEWSALRPFGDGFAQIAHDPVNENYFWAVDDAALPMDELMFPFLPDGTDIAPLFPDAMNVGSLDHMVGMITRDGVVYNVMRHQLLGGTQPHNWHVRATYGQNPWDVWLVNPMNSADYSEIGLDLLLTDDAVYSCGLSATGLNTTIGRVLKVDLQGNVLWNVTWDPSGTTGSDHFSSVAVIGDSVFCAAFPYLVILDPTDGSVIDAYDMFQSVPIVTGDARLLAHGTRLYWVMPQGNLLHYGQFDFAIGQGQVGVETVLGQYYRANIAVDQYENCWLTTNDASGGRWFRFDYDLNSLGSGTLYSSISDMRCVNGKISFSGRLDATTPASYVVTGTPQP